MVKQVICNSKIENYSSSQTDSPTSRLGGHHPGMDNRQQTLQEPQGMQPTTDN